MIDIFKGQYYFLSNFYPHPIYYGGMIYTTSEHAYQAMKATNEEDARLVRNQLTAKMAKLIGGEIKKREDWDSVSYDLMLEIVRAKFQNPLLRAKLLDTGDEYLKEGNYWHDNIWGDCTCGREKCQTPGKNWLGEILMRVRNEIKNQI